MKLFRILPLVVGSAAGIFVSTSPAHALDFDFNFTGTNNFTVSGTIYGLTDGATGSASDIQVTSTSNPQNTYTGSLFLSGITINQNSFTVSSGNITGATVFFQGTASTPYSLFLLGSNDYSLNYLQTDGNQTNSGPFSTYNELGFTGATYSTAVTVPFNIPGGATIPAFGGLLALGAMRKVRKSMASKTRIANPVNATVS